MGLAEYRERRGLTQEAAAAELGLASKGYFSSLESGRVSCPIKLALRIEAWSDGAVRAVDLLPPEDAQLLSQVVSRAHAPSAA